jgi:hypothetical protein
MKLKIILLAAFGAIVACGTADAQRVALKTNFVTWATTSPNLALEFATGKRTTFEFGGSYNPFKLGGHKQLKHWLVQPEFRRWNCERFNRGFWGLHALGGEFNASGIKVPFNVWPGLKDYRYEGWFVGGGVSYGYDWYIGPHWNLEATVGAGYVYVRGTRYECGDCGAKLDKKKRNYVGPTKLGVSLSYLF